MIQIPNGPKISKRLYRKLQDDLQHCNRAYLTRGFFGWYRLSPDRVTVLNPVYSKEAEEAARKEGILVEGIEGVH